MKNKDLIKKKRKKSIGYKGRRKEKPDIEFCDGNTPIFSLSFDSDAKLQTPLTRKTPTFEEITSQSNTNKTPLKSSSYCNLDSNFKQDYVPIKEDNYINIMDNLHFFIPQNIAQDEDFILDRRLI